MVAFVRVRSHDPLPASATGETVKERLTDAAPVRDYDRALSAGAG
jgi:hypothetical protein